MRTFNLPDLGEGLQDAEIVTWHVAPGDHVVADQPLVSVETDKAVVEMPAPESGTVSKLHAEVGDVVKVGAPLIAFEGAEERAARPEPGGIVGELKTAEEARQRQAAAPAKGRAPAGGSGVKAAPAVRALARRLGLELAALTGSGPDSAILSGDVERAASEAAATLEGLTPLRGVRRAMAQRMAKAHAEVVPATVIDDADIDAWPAGEDVTLRLIHAVVAGCRAEPALNAWFDGAASGRRLNETIDLGIAVDMPDGLFVPVLRDVGGREAADLREGLNRMKRDIRNRSIPAEELRGATITLSNFGTIAGRYAAPVVVPPQVAIVSAGRIASRVVAAEGQPAVRRVLPISLTFDHRVVTGGEAARFLAAVLSDLAAG